MKPTAPVVAIGQRIKNPNVNIEFLIYSKKSFRCCYSKLFKIIKSDHNFIIYHKDETMSYSIPIYKKDSEFLLIINNISIEKFYKYKLVLFLNGDEKNTTKFYNINKLLSHILMLYDSFQNVNYNLL